MLERDGTEVDATLCFSDALSKIQTEWSLLDPQDEMGEVKTFQTMDIGGLCKLRHRGTAKVAAPCTFTCAAYNLVRLRTSLAEPSSA